MAWVGWEINSRTGKLPSFGSARHQSYPLLTFLALFLEKDFFFFLFSNPYQKDLFEPLTRGGVGEAYLFLFIYLPQVPAVKQAGGTYLHFLILQVNTNFLPPLSSAPSFPCKQLVFFKGMCPKEGTTHFRAGICVK